jgi:uncharacterized damage-inducible protein DinB
MRNSEFFAKRLDTELPAFLKVIRAVPADKLDFRPHERNTPAGALAAQMAMEMDSLTGLFENGTIDYKSAGAPTTIDAIAEMFERGAKSVAEGVRGISDELWEGPAKFLYDGNVAWESTVDDMAWGFLFDLIHHRGQLSVYLRPMGAKVPSIYGPSADDPGGG